LAGLEAGGDGQTFDGFAERAVARIAAGESVRKVALALSAIPLSPVLDVDTLVAATRQKCYGFFNF